MLSMTQIWQRLSSGVPRRATRGPRRARVGDEVLIQAEHSADFWHGAPGVLIADLGETGKLVSYREGGQPALILGVVPRESWGRSPIEEQARPDILICGTVALS